MAKYMTEVSLPDNHYIAIGRIVAHWSVMEWSAGRAIAEILGLTPKEGRAFTAEMRGQEVLKVLRLVAMLRYTDSVRLEGLLNLIDTLENLTGDRNLIAHGNWGRNDQGQLHLIRYKGGKRHTGRISGKARPMEATELSALESEITKPCLDLIHWVDELIDTRKASH